MFFFVKEGFISFFRNKRINALVMLALCVSIFFALMFYLLTKNIDYILEQIKRDISVIVYLEDGLSDQQKNKIGETLKNAELHFIDNIRFVNKEMALADLKLKSRELPQLIEGIIENPLPDYFEIELKEVNEQYLNKLKNIILSSKGVESVDLGEKNLQKLEKLRNNIWLAMTAATIIMALFIAFIIYNTMQLAVYNREHEIEIQKMIGATKMNIRLPFIMESLIAAVLSASIAYSLLLVVFTALSRNVIQSPFFKSFQFIFFDEFETGIFYCGLVLISVFSAAAAVSRFLHMTVDDE